LLIIVTIDLCTMKKHTLNISLTFLIIFSLSGIILNTFSFNINKNSSNESINGNWYLQSFSNLLNAEKLMI
jgi:hypothetical protein